MAACQSVHLAGNLFSTAGFGTEIAHIVRCERNGRIGEGALVEKELQGGYVVDVIMFVEDFDAGLCLEYRHVLGIIHEYGLDRLDLTLLKGGQEIALLVTVGDDGGNLRGVDLLVLGIWTDALVCNYVAVFTEILVRPVHDVLLGEF